MIFAAAAVLVLAFGAFAFREWARPASGGGSVAGPAQASPVIVFRPHVSGAAATFAITTEFHGRRAFTSRFSSETWSPPRTAESLEDPR